MQILVGKTVGVHLFLLLTERTRCYIMPLLQLLLKETVTSYFECKSIFFLLDSSKVEMLSMRVEQDYSYFYCVFTVLVTVATASLTLSPALVPSSLTNHLGLPSGTLQSPLHIRRTHVP